VKRLFHNGFTGFLSEGFKVDFSDDFFLPILSGEKIAEKSTSSLVIHSPLTHHFFKIYFPAKNF
jgi:hypothetical protein